MSWESYIGETNRARFSFPPLHRSSTLILPCISPFLKFPNKHHTAGTCYCGYVYMFSKRWDHYHLGAPSFLTWDSSSSRLSSWAKSCARPVWIIPSLSADGRPRRASKREPEHTVTWSVLLLWCAHQTVYISRAFLSSSSTLFHFLFCRIISDSTWYLGLQSNYTWLKVWIFGHLWQTVGGIAIFLLNRLPEKAFEKYCQFSVRRWTAEICYPVQIASNYSKCACDRYWTIGL